MKEKYVSDLREIKDMMHRSSRFTSVSGTSGIVVGILALCAVFIVQLRYEDLFSENTVQKSVPDAVQWELVAVGLVTLVIAIAIVAGLTIRQARKSTSTIWNKPTRLLVTHLALPLLAGGIVCLFLISHDFWGWLLPFTLLFYGLALLNASHFTLSLFRKLAFWQMALGLLSLYFIAWSLWFWTFGFGVLHIVYGIMLLRTK
jgi:hypothetical protein